MNPRETKFAETTATLLSDGSIDVSCKIYSSLSDAAGAIVGSVRNGWWFILVDPHTKKDMCQVRTAYLESIFADGEDDDLVDDDEE